MMEVFEPELVRKRKINRSCFVGTMWGTICTSKKSFFFEFPNVNFAQLRRKEIEILQNNSHMSEAPQQLKLDWQ